VDLQDLIQDDPARGTFRVHRSALTSPEIFALERERIFNHCWLYLGHESEVEQPGDFVRRRVANRPLFFVRGQDGQVRAFLNTCPHRGALVCRQDAGNAEVFQCFYHAWSFNDRGELVGLPDEEGYAEGFDRAERGLLSVRLESYRGFYFVNFDPEAEDLATYLAGAKDYLDLLADQSETGLGLRIVRGSTRYNIAANWKLLAENSLDGYHAAPVHQTLFNYLRTFKHEIFAPFGATLGEARALGNGHAVTEKPSLVGRPIAQWHPMYGEAARDEIAAIHARLVERYGEERAFRIANSGKNLLIYPNLVINDNFAVTIRVFWPVRPDLMEVTAWGIFPREDVGARLERQLHDFELALGPGGFATPDDAEALESCQAGFEAAEMEWSDISRGMGRQPKNRDELQMRIFWRQWQAQIQGRRTADSWDDQRSAATKTLTTSPATGDD
jgi:p-cumate 2,3-dioxygenase alpha subunit